MDTNGGCGGIGGTAKWSFYVTKVVKVRNVAVEKSRFLSSFQRLGGGSEGSLGRIVGGSSLRLSKQRALKRTISGTSGKSSKCGNGKRSLIASLYIVKWRGRDVSHPYENHTTGEWQRGYFLSEHFVTLLERWR